MKIHLCMQNIWFTDADISPYGVVNDIISVNGSAFTSLEFDEGEEAETEAGRETEDGGEVLEAFEEFINASEEEIEENLVRYTTHNTDLLTMVADPIGTPPSTETIILMDLESPHPNGWHKNYSDSEQASIVLAFKRRIKVTRKVFPRSKIALYGILVPDGRGRFNDTTYLAREASLIKAGRRGLYDDLDYLTPVLYTRFGCNVPGSDCDGNEFKTIGAMTQLGIEGSKKLLKSDGSPTPLLPLLNFSVNNGNSAFHRKLIMDFGVPDPLGDTLKWQLNILERNEVKDVGLWVGGKNFNLITLKDTPNPNKRTITGYLHALFGNNTYQCRFSLKP